MKKIRFLVSYYKSVKAAFNTEMIRLKVGIRWRIEKEVVTGKGQFSCGEQYCMENGNLRTWEVNFAYTEHGMKKNSLVKIRKF